MGVMTWRSVSTSFRLVRKKNERDDGAEQAKHRRYVHRTRTASPIIPTSSWERRGSFGLRREEDAWPSEKGHRTLRAVSIPQKDRGQRRVASVIVAWPHAFCGSRPGDPASFLYHTRGMAPTLLARWRCVHKPMRSSASSRKPSDVTRKSGSVGPCDRLTWAGSQ